MGVALDTGGGLWTIQRSLWMTCDTQGCHTGLQHDARAIGAGPSLAVGCLITHPPAGFESSAALFE